MKSFYYFLVVISLLAFGFSGVATSINGHLGLVFKENPSPKKQDKLKSQKQKELKNVSKIPHFPLLTGQITTTYAMPPSITATNSVAVQGGGSALPGGQLNYTVVINNGGTDATGVVYTDALNSNLTLVSGSVKASPIAVNDAYNSIGNVGITVPVANGVLINDSNPITSNTVTITAFDATSTNGGTVTMTTSGANAGAFTYTPAAGFNGSDTFTYTIDNGSGITNSSRTATVSITVSTPIWFIDAAYAGGSNNGTLAKPYTTVNAFQAVNNGTTAQDGDFIFVYSGTYSSSGLTLRNTQKLIGQDATSSIPTITGVTTPTFSNTLPSTSGSTVTIANTTATPITLGSANEIQGCTVTSTSGTTMSGASVGALKIRETVLSNTAGQALQITADGALDVQFKSITANSSNAASVSKGISVNSSTGSFQILGTGTTAGSGGTISSITSRGAEFISCTNVTLKNMNFTNANTTAGTTPTQTDNSDANAALYFKGVTGITLDNIQMNAAVGNTNAQNGINLFSCSGFSLANSTITRCGIGVDQACLYAINTSGTNTISNSTLSKASRIARFTNNSTNMTLKVTGSSFNDTRTFPDNTATNLSGLNANGQAGILFEGFGTSQMSLDVKSSCNFLRCATQGIDAYANETSTVKADVQSSTFNSTNTILPTGEDVGTAIDCAASGSAIVKFNILNNTITGRGGPLVNVFTAANVSANAEGTIDGNTINYNFQPTINNNGGSGIRVNHNSTNTTTRVKINGNTLTNFGASFPIDVLVNGTTGRADIICTNNNLTIGTANFGPLNDQTPPNYGIRMSAAQTGQTVTICTKTAGNTMNAAGVGGLAQMRAANLGNVHLFEGNNSGITTGGGMQSIWNNAGNTPTATDFNGGGGNVLSVGGSGTITYGATCVAPSNPALSLRIAAPEEVASEQLENPEEVSVKADEVILTENPSENTPSTESTNSSAKIAAPLSGETITVDGTGSGFSLPAGKSTTIKYSATISSTPTACPIPDQGTVSGSNFTSVQTNLVNTSFTVSPINTVTATSTAICSGAGTSVSAVCPAGTVTWYTAASGGSSVATGSPYAPTNITTTTSYYASCVIGTCESIRTLVGSVTINAAPTASPSSNSPVCVGNTLNLSSTVATSYLWSGPSSYTSTLQNPVVSSATTAAGGTYNLTVTNASGCTATASVSVTINALPTATANSNSPICSAASLNLSVTATGTAPLTYTWSGTGTFTNGTTAMPSVTGAATGNYTVSVSNSCGTATSTVAVTVNLQPTITAGTAVNPSTCAGTNGSIPFTTNLADGAYTLNYTKAGTATTTSINVATGAFTLSSLSSGIYTAFAITRTGCTGNDAAVKTLTDPTAPTITAGTAVNPTTCTGSNGSIPFTTNLADGSYTLNYTKGGTAATASINVATGVFTLSSLSAGIYNAFSVTRTGCTGNDAAVKTLTDPTAPTITAGTAVNPTTCTGTNGSIPFTTNLADGTYTLNYTKAGTATTANIIVTTGVFTLSGLSAGAYTAFSVTRTGCTGNDAAVKTLTEPASVLAINFESTTLTTNGSANLLLVNSSCKVIAALTPNGGNPVAGSVLAKVWIGSPTSTYVGRKFEITPASNPNTATAKVTLFVLQSEFTTYNNQSPTPTRLLPANPTDAAGIANVFIFKKAGTSSDNSGNPSTYAGAVTTIDPLDADIVWNNTESRWEISFQVSGFSGFVIGTPPLGCNLPNITQEPVGQKICNGQGFSLSVAANSATSYQWELNGVAIVGANASTYAIPVVAANQLGTYTVVVSNILATCAVRSANAIVEAKVSHFLQFQGCNCGGGGPLKVSIVGGTSPYSFEYMTSGGPSTFSNYLSGATVTLPQNITQGRAISVTDALGCKSID